MIGSPVCRHCGKPIKPSYAKYNHGWVHEDSSYEGRAYCQTTMAEPEERRG